MSRFYFNDCLPPADNMQVFSGRFCETLEEFNTLLKMELDIEQAIFTATIPSESFFGNAFSLQEVIKGIGNHDQRTLAYALFTRYPVGAHFADTDDAFVTNDYDCLVDSERFDAINLAIVQSESAFLFTPAVVKALRVNPLVFSIKSTNHGFELPNLYGDAENTKAIEKEIRERAAAELELYERLLFTLGTTFVTNQFPRNFRGLNAVDQNSILKHFSDARQRGGPTPFFADGDLIKDVTSNKAKCSVSELRIFQPNALRVYFSEVNGAIFLASIGFKNSGDQSNDIDAARKALEKLIKTSM